MRTRPLERPVAPAATNLFSSTNGFTPRCARWKARLAPCTPAPTMMTSAVFVMSLDLRRDDALRPRFAQAFLNGADQPPGCHRVDQGDHVAAAASPAELGAQGPGAPRRLDQAIQIRRGNRHALQQSMVLIHQLAQFLDLAE